MRRRCTRGSRLGWSELRSLADRRWHLIQGPRAELYDLERDPRETRDLAAAEPAVAARLQAELERRLPAAARPPGGGPAGGGGAPGRPRLRRRPRRRPAGAARAPCPIRAPACPSSGNSSRRVRRAEAGELTQSEAELRRLLAAQPRIRRGAARAWATCSLRMGRPGGCRGRAGRRRRRSGHVGGRVGRARRGPAPAGPARRRGDRGRARAGREPDARARAVARIALRRGDLARAESEVQAARRASAAASLVARPGGRGAHPRRRPGGRARATRRGRSPGPRDAARRGSRSGVPARRRPGPPRPARRKRRRPTGGRSRVIRAISRPGPTSASCCFCSGAARTSIGSWRRWRPRTRARPPPRWRPRRSRLWATARARPPGGGGRLASGGAGAPHTWRRDSLKGGSGDRRAARRPSLYLARQRVRRRLLSSAFPRTSGRPRTGSCAASGTRSGWSAVRTSGALRQFTPSTGVVVNGLKGATRAVVGVGEDGRADAAAGAAAEVQLAVGAAPEIRQALAVEEVHGGEADEDLRLLQAQPVRVVDGEVRPPEGIHVERVARGEVVEDGGGRGRVSQRMPRDERPRVDGALARRSGVPLL